MIGLWCGRYGRGIVMIGLCCRMYGDVVWGMGCVWWCAMYGDVAVVLDMEGTWWCDMGVERMGMWNGMWEVWFELYGDVT